MIKPSFLQRWLGGAAWEIVVHEVALSYGEGKGVAYSDISSVATRSGLIWNRVHLRSPSGDAELKGVPKRLSRVLVRLLPEMRGVMAFARAYEAFLSTPRYIANFDVQRFLATLSEAGQTETWASEVEALLNKYAPENAAACRCLRTVLQWHCGDLSSLRERNEQFMRSEAHKHEELFRTVESQALTPEQVKAALVFEDRNLLIAAAGSGKTSTLVAKVAYGLESGLVKPDEILVLAFNKNAQEELRARCSNLVRRLLGQQVAISIHTFHALGLNIVAQSRNSKPTLSKWAAESASDDGKVIGDIAEELIRNDSGFATKIAEFVAVWSSDLQDELSWLAEGNGETVDTRDMTVDGRPRYTVNGEIVKSGQEVSIANWAYLHSVAYEYEKPFPVDTSTAEHRRYHPDFFYSSAHAWHEHFALDAKGNPPPHFRPGYLAGVHWKRAVHKRYNTRFFETHSAHFSDGTVYSRLDKHLRALGITPVPRAWTDVKPKLARYGLPRYYSLLRVCIKHLKNNEYSVEDLRQRADAHPFPERARAFVEVLAPVFAAYQARLRCANEVDFEDMILQATKHVRAGDFAHNYKLILVDEFQDISPARAGLLKALLAVKPEAKLFAVGDDWQSIYRFTGSDISFMGQFSKHFGYTATRKLEATFRSNQGLANVAAEFVQKNPAQLKKQVRSRNKRVHRVVEILPVFDETELNQSIEVRLDAITARNNGSKVSC